ncbi:MAG: type IV secretory system conjugative DNA transfer family protein [Flavobacteriales bacterium]|nr:type IV secretory system conjugative DNA transfer family protein [Flavobacteriales bacterium]
MDLAILLFNLWLIGAIIALLVLFALLPSDQRSKELQGNFDSSLGTISMWNTGVAIAGINKQLSKSASYRSSATISGSGGGKSSVVLLPSLFQSDTTSKLVLDPKGELRTKSSGFLAMTHKVEVLRFNSMDSLGYNPLKRATSITAKYKLAHALFGKQSDHDFWGNSGQNLCVLLWRIQDLMAEQYRTLGYTNQLLAQMLGNPKQVDSFVARSTIDNPEVYNAYKAFIAQDSKVQSNVISTVLATLKIFNDPIVNAVTGRDDIDLSALRTTQTVLFVESGLDTYYQPLVSCFFEQVFDEILSQYPKEEELDLLMILEEFGSVYVPSFPIFISNCRANRVMLLYACQSLAQLQTTYHGSATTILDNTNNLIAFGRLSEDLAGQFSRRLGKWQFEDDKGHKVIKNAKEVDELMHLDPDMGILTSGSKRPMLVRLAPYYKYSKYSKYAKMPPVEFKGHLPTHIPYLDLDKLNSNTGSDV